MGREIESRQGCSLKKICPEWRFVKSVREPLFAGFCRKKLLRPATFFVLRSLLFGLKLKKDFFFKR
jgi:hypothetical protein